MFNAMQENTDSHQWTAREKSVEQLIAWWSKMPSYDPDMEPEGLIRRLGLTPLSKEVLGIAAAHRVRPGLLSWSIPKELETNEWIKSSNAGILGHVLKMEDTGSWWNRCLFEGSNERYHARTEHLVVRLMAEHPLVQMSAGLNIPLSELLPVMNSSNAVSNSDMPGLPDLC